MKLFASFSLSIAATLSAFAAYSGEKLGTLPDHFSAADIFNLEYVRDPRISPSGRDIVYVRTSMDIMTDAMRSNLWTIETDGQQNRPLSSGRDNYSSPRWSPSADRLAYVSSKEGSAQIYLRWMDTGQSALLTNLSDSPSSISWSPDGQWLAFTMRVPASKQPLAEAPKKPKGAKWAPPVKLIDSLVYRADGAGFLEAGHEHVFVIPAEGGTPRQVTTGDFNHNGPLSWTPDSKRIVLSANRRDDWQYHPRDENVFIANVATGELTQLTDRDGPDAEAQVSPDGKRISYVGFDDKNLGYQITRLYVMNIDGSGKQSLSDSLDRSVMSPSWSGNNRIFFQYENQGIGKLASSNLSGTITEHAAQLGGTTLGRPYTSGSYSVANNGQFAFTLNSASHPADLASGKSSSVKRLTRLNNELFAHKKLANVEPMKWKSAHDQRDIQGWLATPPDFDPAQKYPFILEIHGGPYAAYGPNFSAEVQRYAAEGYVVLYANPRGSTSYGEEFASLINYAYPGNDYDDLMSGVDAVIAKGFVDEQQLFVTGGSGGGVLSAWIIGKTNRFAAAVVAKPVINMTSFVLTADAVNYFSRYWFKGFPWEQQEEYWRRSPLSLVGNVKTPTMLLTGEADYRTPISESEQFYIALKLQKVDSALLRVPEASHGIAARPSNLIAKVDNILAWFEKYRAPTKKEEAAN
ncbi:MAG: prolyl oligopeptidase family serine peptidase [Pseudomonadales bacterium]